MTDFLVPIGVLVVSLATTYYFCLRPMRRGHCGPGARQKATHDDVELSLQQARLDLARLRAGLTDEAETRARTSSTVDVPRRRILGSDRAN